MGGSQLRSGLVAPWHALRQTLRDRSLLRFQAAWAAAMTGSWAATITLTVTAYSAGGSATVALAVLARTVPGAVVGPVIGAVVDRGSRQVSMVVAACVCAVACVAAAVRLDMVLVVLAMTVVAIATMIFRATLSAVMPELVDGVPELVAANVMSSAIESFGVFAGPALAGLLLVWRGPQFTFLVAAGLFVLAGLLLMHRSRRAHRVADVESAQPASVRALAGVAAARLVLSLVFAQTVVSGALAVLYAGLAVEGLGRDVGSVGLLTSAFGLGGVVGSVALFALAGSGRLGVFTAAALALWAVPLTVMPLVPSLAGVLVLLAVVGLGNVLFDVTTVTLLQRGVSTTLATRAFGVLETVVVLGLGTGAVVAPPLERLLGPSGALAVLGGLLLVVCLAGVRPLRRLDAHLVAPTRQIALLRGLAAFTLLPAPELERIALRLRPLTVEPGEDVVRQGEAGDRYFLVEQGQLSASVDGRVVTRLADGDAFGEIALLQDRPRTATVTAETTTRLWTLEGPVFLAALRADDGRALATADALAQARLQRAAPGSSPPPVEGGPQPRS